MMTGFETALGEITLVLFTTLAPSGVFAFMIMAALLVGGYLDETLRRQINQFLCIPLVITMVGLVASATHLGNPANALYVFLGVGRSPLSTEVFCAVLFLFFTGLYWLYSFSRKPHIGFQRAWAAVIILVGAVFIMAIACAYDSRTIVSWNTMFTSLNLWLNALVGGPLVALLTLQVAQAEFVTQVLGKRLCLLSVLALVVNTISYTVQGSQLADIINSFGSVADLVPFYGVLVGVFFFLCLVACALFFIPLRKKKFPRLPISITACCLAYGGIFVMRFAFYMMHMTVGLG